MLSKGDMVKVTKTNCCCGHEHNTSCQIIDIFITTSGKPLYNCFPTDPENQKRVGLWQCDSCITLVTPPDKKE